jgi:hypothetical protein
LPSPREESSTPRATDIIAKLKKARRPAKKNKNKDAKVPMRAASLNLYLMRGATRLGVPRVAFLPHDERRGFAPRLGLGVAWRHRSNKRRLTESVHDQPTGYFRKPNPGGSA